MSAKTTEDTILLKVKMQDEHISELQRGQKALEQKMTSGFDNIRDLLMNSKPEYDIEKIAKTVMSTLFIASSLFAVITFAIKSEVAVPINEGVRTKAEVEKIKNDMSSLANQLNTLSTKQTTLSESVDDASSFTYKYLQEDKVPVQISVLESRVNAIQKDTNMLIESIHKNRGGL